MRKKQQTEDAEDISVLREVWEYIKMIIIVVLVVTLLQTVVFINATVPTPSMEKTIMTGDRIFGNRLAYLKDDPKRFDIVIFKYPDDEKELFVKRVIGLPGETVDIIDGKVYIDGSDIPLEDGFVPETPLGSFGPYEVPEGCYFMMGDNRNYSQDSRVWNNHFVEKKKIVAKAVFRYYPSMKIIK